MVVRCLCPPKCESWVGLKYGFCKKSLRKDAPLTSRTLFSSQKGTCSTMTSYKIHVSIQPTGLTFWSAQTSNNHHFYLFYSSNPKTVNSSPNDLKYNDYDRNVAHPHRRACPLFFLDGPCCIWILVVITRMMTNNTPGKNALSRPLPPPLQSPSQPLPPAACLPSSWEIIKKGSMHVGRPCGRTETKWREKDF